MYTTETKNLHIANKHFNEIDLEVGRVFNLDESMSCEIRFMSEAISNNHDEGFDKASDRFLIIIQKGDKVETFDYYTGVGHRINSLSTSQYKPSIAVNSNVMLLAGVTCSNATNKVNQVRGVNPNTINNQWIVKPSLASWLSSSLYNQYVSQESFNEFCDNYGYDNDSMSAFNTYQACCNEWLKFSKVFNPDQIELFSEMLQDY